MHWTDTLPACMFAQWARATAQPDLVTAWRVCERSDHMIDLLRCGQWPTRERDLRLIAADIAERALPRASDEDREILRDAIDDVRRYARGEVGADVLAAARARAWAGWSAASDDAVAGVGTAVAAAASPSADDAADAADAVAGVRRAHADIVRRYVEAR